MNYQVVNGLSLLHFHWNVLFLLKNIFGPFLDLCAKYNLGYESDVVDPNDCQEKKWILPLFQQKLHI